MPDSNCRSCGCALQIETLCIFCHQPIRLACSNCGFFADKKMHLKCGKPEFLLSRSH